MPAEAAPYANAPMVAGKHVILLASTKDRKASTKSIYGRTQGEVRKKLSAVVVQIDNGTYTEPSKVRLSVWLDLWFQDYTGNLKPATKSAYEEHIRVHISPIWAM